MNNINWDEVTETASSNPTPGGYAAKIINVEDVEAKQYLRLEWDFGDGPFKGSNQATYDRAGFWPTVLYRSYKPTALGFFKAFKVAVEASNPGFTFQNDPQSLVGKWMGVVLGGEEYTKRDGTVGKRLYVSEVCPGQDIRDGKFKVPEFKRLPGSVSTAYAQAAQGTAQFGTIPDDDADCPWI